MWGWRALAALSIFLPLLTSLCAYFGFKQTDPGTKEVFTGLAFVLPLFTSLFSTMQNVFKVRENEALREYGRIEVRDIILNGRSLKDWRGISKGLSRNSRAGQGLGD